MKKVTFQLSTSQQDPSRMYPKVKVRMESQRQDRLAAHEHDWNSLLSLKDIQFLSLQDSCFPVKRRLDDSPPAKARIPKSYVPSVVMPSVPIAEEVHANTEELPTIVMPSVPISEEVHVNIGEIDTKTNLDEEDTRIRASLIPRPRAVISSPDNDAMIGHKNKTTAIRPAVLAKRTSIPNRHVLCKVVPTCTEEESPASAMNSSDNSDAKFETKGKKGSATAATGGPRKKRSPFRI